MNNTPNEKLCEIEWNRLMLALTSASQIASNETLPDSERIVWISSLLDVVLHSAPSLDQKYCGFESDEQFQS
jgi:hypothetical protein